MTNPNKTLIAVLLDRSGSMTTIKEDVEGGFNAFIAEQKKVEGTCRVTLAQFDNTYDVVYTDKDINDVPSLDLQPRGMTALLDSMGKLITDTGAELASLPEDERPGSVIVAIMTDGQENSSREWARPQIKKLVEEQTEKYGWQFLYLGADQDAIEVGTSVGILADNSLTYTRGNAAQVMAMTSCNVAAYRSSIREGDVLASVSYSAEQREDAVK